MITVLNAQQISCDRCFTEHKLAPNDSMPAGWARFSGPTHMLVDLCPSCIASFEAWMNLLKTK